jgi:hypothetical protein
MGMTLPAGTAGRLVKRVEPESIPAANRAAGIKWSFVVSSAHASGAGIQPEASADADPRGIPPRHTRRRFRRRCISLVLHDGWAAASHAIQHQTERARPGVDTVKIVIGTVVWLRSSGLLWQAPAQDNRS